MSTQHKTERDKLADWNMSARGEAEPLGVYLVDPYLYQLWGKALQHADTHCWNCESELPADAREAGDTCPHCGADVVPF